MASFKPLLFTLVLILTIGAILNLTVGNHVDLTSPASGSVLEGFSNFMENGWALSITVPIFGSIDTTINPVSWLWLGINSVDDFMVEQINLLSYLPDALSLPLLIVSILAFAFSILTLIRGN